MYDIPFKINWPYTYIDTYLHMHMEFWCRGEGNLIEGADKSDSAAQDGAEDRSD